MVINDFLIPFQFPVREYVHRVQRAAVPWVQRSSAAGEMVSCRDCHTAACQLADAAVTAVAVSVSVNSVSLHDYAGPSPSAGLSRFPTAAPLQISFYLHGESQLQVTAYNY